MSGNPKQERIILYTPNIAKTRILKIKIDKETIMKCQPKEQELIRKTEKHRDKIIKKSDINKKPNLRIFDLFTNIFTIPMIVALYRTIH